MRKVGVLLLGAFGVGLAGSLVATQRDEPMLFVALACEHGFGVACSSAERFAAARYGDYEALELDVGCVLRKNGFACEEVADALDARDGTRARERRERARHLHEGRCAHGDPDSCEGLDRVRDELVDAGGAPR